MLKEDIFFHILKVVIIYNAVQNGWKIKRINNKSFILKKKKRDDNSFNLTDFLDKITPSDVGIKKILRTETSQVHLGTCAPRR